MRRKRNEEDGQRGGLVREGQKKKKKKKRKIGRERENKAHGRRKSGSLHSHAKSSDGVFTPRRCRNQTHPSSLHVAATDNKQLFTCWTRAGEETKVFCQ